jgi:hypothetical protein
MNARRNKALFALGCSALALLMGAGAAFPQSGPQLHMQEVFPLDRQVRDSLPSVAPERRFDRAAPSKTVLYEERGGRIVDHWERWKALAAQV